MYINNKQHTFKDFLVFKVKIVIFSVIYFLSCKMEIKFDWGNIQFWQKIFFSNNSTLKERAINLMATTWQAIINEKRKEFIIDYPGEYEKYHIYIQALKWNTDRLNFFIQDYDEKISFAFIQDPSVLENLDLAKYPSKWYYLDEIVYNQIERLGFEWETILISE